MQVSCGSQLLSGSGPLSLYANHISASEGDYINQLQDLTEAEDKNKDYLTIIKQVEKQTKTKILDDDKQVLPDVLKKAKDKSLVDSWDTE